MYLDPYYLHGHRVWPFRRFLLSLPVASRVRTHIAVSSFSFRLFFPTFPPGIKHVCRRGDQLVRENRAYKTISGIAILKPASQERPTRIVTLKWLYHWLNKWYKMLVESYRSCLLCDILILFEFLFHIILTICKLKFYISLATFNKYHEENFPHFASIRKNYICEL